MKDSGILSFGKDLGKGAYGAIKEVKTNISYKPMVSKLLYKKINDTVDLKDILEFRGPNIVKIFRILNATVNNKNYSMVLMEKASLKDLSVLHDYYINHNLLKLLHNPFIQIISENFSRFYAQQLISSLVTLENYSYVHLDIKPQNILIDFNIVLKLCDFSLLTDIKDKQLIKIAGGTKNYVGPEYYTERKMKSEYAKMQDYYGFGAILYYLKFGENLLKYKTHKTTKKEEKKQKDKKKESIQKDLIANEIIEQIKARTIYIKSRKELDLNFINFLCGLIEIDYHTRSNFEKIYRNKWVNTEKQYLNNITSNNEGDEEKLIMELQKADFLKAFIKAPKRKRILFKKDSYRILDDK